MVENLMGTLTKANQERAPAAEKHLLSHHGNRCICL